MIVGAVLSERFLCPLEEALPGSGQPGGMGWHPASVALDWSTALSLQDAWCQAISAGNAVALATRYSCFAVFSSGTAGDIVAHPRIAEEDDLR